MNWFKKPTELVFKSLGKVVTGPGYLKTISIATLSMTEVLLKQIKSSLAQDIGQIKHNFLHELTAKVDIAESDAKKERIANAIEAANKENEYKRKNALAQAELEQKKVNTKKIDAEAQAKLMRADGQRAKDVAEAYERLSEATSRLKQEGGDVFYCTENLQAIIKKITDATTKTPAIDKVTKKEG